MNIFYLHHDTKKCAELHNDKHVVKMILEYAQLLSTAHRFIDGVPSIDRGTRTGRQRTSYILSDSRDAVLYLYTPPTNIPKGVGFTEPTPAMPDEYKVSGNSVRSYINYYVGAKKHLASWKKRQTPEWFTYA